MLAPTMIGTASAPGKYRVHVQAFSFREQPLLGSRHEAHLHSSFPARKKTPPAGYPLLTSIMPPDEDGRMRFEKRKLSFRELQKPEARIPKISLLGNRVNRGNPPLASAL